jgi:PncC family amidohydrolase
MAAALQSTGASTESLEDIANQVIQKLRDLGETVGVAESLTGGGVMAALTSVSGSSAAFRGGVVSYAPYKEELLHVDKELIKTDGVIDGEVAAQLAEDARDITSSDDIKTVWGIGTTGVAGPDSQDGKPAGMVFIGIVGHGKRNVYDFQFTGNHEQIRNQTVLEALKRLRLALDARSELKQ